MLTIRPAPRHLGDGLISAEAAVSGLPLPPQRVTFGGGVFSVLLSQMEQAARDQVAGKSAHITLKTSYVISGASSSAADQAVVATLKAHEQKIIARYDTIAQQNLIQYNKAIQKIAATPGVIRTDKLPAGVSVSMSGAVCQDGTIPRACDVPLPTNAAGAKMIPTGWLSVDAFSMSVRSYLNEYLPWYVTPHKTHLQAKDADFTTVGSSYSLPPTKKVVFTPVVNGQYPMWIIDPPPSVKAIYNRQWMLFIKSEGNHVYSFDLTMKPKEFDFIAWIEDSIAWVINWACSLITAPALQVASNTAAAAPEPHAQAAAAAWQTAAAACGLLLPPPTPGGDTLAPGGGASDFWAQYQTPIVAGVVGLLALLGVKTYRDRRR